VIPYDLFNGVQELKQLTLELGSSPSAANFQNNKKLVSVELLNLDALELENNTTLSLFSHMTDLKVNLFQKPSFFLHQLTHNITRDCPLNSPKNTSSQHVVYKNCFVFVSVLTFKTIFVHNML
jgi:hypothetical protein